MTGISDADRWQKVNDLFHAAIARDAAEQPAFLAEVCGADAALRAQIERLLRAHQQASGFMGTSAAEATAGLLTSDDHVIGAQRGAYRIVREIGRGGMGAVYLAERADAQYEKRVALKLIKRGMDTDAMLARFRDERQILAFLDHPNIARLLDGGTTPDGRPYLVMELVEGEPIDAFCDRHRMSVDDRLRLFLRVCAAVSYAHQHLVVHRDIKPSNILVSADGTPKLLDFGIARILHDAEAGTMATMPEVRRLTPEYASPEQIQGRRATTATDVYSLGVVLYELLSGRALHRFAHATHDDILRAVADTRPRPPSDAAVAGAADHEPAGVPAPQQRAQARAESGPERLRRRLRGDLDTIVLKALRKEPERRYLSVDLFAEDVRRHLEGRPVLARADTLAYRAGKFVRRNKGPAAAGLLIGLTLLGGIVATAWQARRAQAQERIAKVEQARAQRRFDDVRKLARAVMFDYHDAIKDLPGATPVRARLVRDALEYLDALSGDAGGDVSLRRELASAYERVGEVQGGTMFANLGDTAGAIGSYRKALALREAVAAEDPASRDARRDLAATHRQVGVLLWETGDVAGAVESARRALSTFQALDAMAPGDTNLSSDLGRAHDTLGMILQETGDTAGAMENYLQSLRFYEALEKTDPASPRVRRGLSTAHEHLGTLQLQTGKLGEALASNRKALELRAALVADFPFNADYRRTLLVSYYNEGEILAAMGRMRDALESYRRNLAIAEELSASDPANEQYRGDMAYAFIRIGDMRAGTGAHSEALVSYRRSLALRAEDVASDPGNLWKRSSLIEAHAKIAKALAKAGQPSGASSAYAETVSLMDRTTIEPTNVQFRSFFATTYADLGEAQAALAADRRTPPADRPARWRLARAMYQRSHDVWTELRARGILDSVDAPKIDGAAREIARCDRMLRGGT